MKTILITGATCELGKALCQQLIQQSHQLILTGRSTERLLELSQALGDKVYIAPSDFTDVTTFASVTHLVKLIAADGLDGMILIPPQPEATTEMFPDKARWDLLFNKSFIGPTVLLGQIMPYLVKKAARIVLISGVSSRQPFGHYTTSNTIRTAWLGFLKTIADNYGSQGIRFNALSIGGIMTKKFEEQLSEEAQNKQVDFSEVLAQRCANVPLRRYAEIPEIVDMVNFLLTSLASQHITGQNMVFDGGFTRAY